MPMTSQRVQLEHLGLHERRGLCHLWVDDAKQAALHARTYDRVAVELIEMGAPAELVRSARRASASKRVHARLCIDIASAYAGTPLDPDAVELDEAPRGYGDPIVLAMTLVRSSCVGATIASMAARNASTHCADLVIRRTLRRVAVDETRNAGLGWAYLKWALGRGGALVAGNAFLLEAVGAALDEERSACTIPSPPRHASREQWLAEQGRLSAAKRAAITLETLRDVVVPCARAMMESMGHGAAADVA
jgi:hypothetical protein